MLRISATGRLTSDWVARVFMTYRRPFIVLAHALLVAIAYLLAYLLRFDFALPQQEWDRYFVTLPFLVILRLVLFARFGLFRGLWQYVSVSDFFSIFKATTLGTLSAFTGQMIFLGPGFSRAVLLLEWLLSMSLLAGARLVIRVARERSNHARNDQSKRALVVGAGDGAEALIREVDRSLHLNYDLQGMVDDNPRKQGQRIHGVKVLGVLNDLPSLCSRLDIHEVLIAIPSLDLSERRRIMRLCREAAVPVKTVPTLGEIVDGTAITRLQEVTPEDLLGRPAVHVEREALDEQIRGRAVLVTGAGGSIGSELCRQLASFAPKSLVMLDRAESPLYFTSTEITTHYPGLQVTPVVGDILDKRQLTEIFSDSRPHLVYHAAAYKHVPLMEAHPLEATANNVFGTEVVAAAARDSGADTFVLISTDKAVHPVGIMGMTKRIAECVVLAFQGGGTKYMSVRFGNVLGSAGSVLPLFQEQIARGGPVTVTDPEATRYFMLIAEAAQLVLQAAAMGSGGEVFFLDMGHPIAIKDLAESTIRLSGKLPGADVGVQTIGLRPGERLQEVLVLETEHLVRSNHEKILVAKHNGFARHQFQDDLEALRRSVLERDGVGTVRLLEEMSKAY